ncbi:MAG: Cu(I)-responsive transcriptional regulator [Nitratireductor sp.]|nr:Cu(I)-responsive transcriptional regulator [Nitratireductor sp.]
MNIGEASTRSGLPVKTIRYYEEIGLVHPDRGGNNYRAYGANHVSKLQFVSRARGLGFSIEECRQLLALYEDRNRASADVKAIAKTKMSMIAQKIAELEAMRETLAHLVDHCQGDSRPDCPILNDLAGCDGGREVS